MIIKPQSEQWQVMLKAQSPISHHDPDGRSGNRSLFRRQSKLIDRSLVPASQEQLDSILAILPVPVGIADIMSQAKPDQFLAAAILRMFLDRYNRGDGEGLFSGMERYRFLEQRFQYAAVGSMTLLGMWGRACESLQVSYRDGDDEPTLMRLLTVPAALAQRVLKVLSSTPRPCVMLARLWHETVKSQSEAYATAAGVETAAPETVHMSYAMDGFTQESLVVDIPVVSSNTLRHQMIREPVMWHLYHHLKLDMDDLLPAVNAMFYNGGDKSGTEPQSVFWLRKSIRETFPSIGLISGSTDKFLLGEGELSVHSWIVCRENNDVLSTFGIDSDLSVFEMIDDWTLTRHKGRVEKGQMPFGFETLIRGTEIFTVLSLSPYATELQKGALMAALQAFQEKRPYIGGQSARGFGRVGMQYHDCEPDTAALAAYDKYLYENRQPLREHLLTGTLGTDKVVISS